MRRADRKDMLQLLAALIAALLLALTVAACGSDDDESSTGGSPTEQAFLTGMAAHHQSAIEMAEIAETRGEHAETKQLAKSIIRAQTKEIAELERIHKQLVGEALKPDERAHDGLGLSAKEAGMEHADMSSLEKAEPFDREFIDMMVPHHQGAIRMARVVLDNTDDAELKRLAEGIVQAQAAEIEQMNAWRKDWYGSASAGGGEPEGDDGQVTVEEHH